MSKPWEELTQAEREAHYAALTARRESMKSDPLLPCPFCRNPEPSRCQEHGHIGPNEGLGSGGFISWDYVKCGGCGARHNAPNPDSLHWNTRI